MLVGDLRKALVAVDEAVRVLNALRPLDGSVPLLVPAHGDEDVGDSAARVVVEERPSHASESDILNFRTPS